MLARKIVQLVNEQQHEGTLPDRGHTPVPFQIANVHYILSADQKASADDEEVDLRDLTATQKTIDIHRVRQMLNEPESVDGDPMVVLHGDDKYIADGHHRLTRDFMLGKQTAEVKVVREEDENRIRLIKKVKEFLEAPAGTTEDELMDQVKRSRELTNSIQLRRGPTRRGLEGSLREVRVKADALAAKMRDLRWRRMGLKEMFVVKVYPNEGQAGVKTLGRFNSKDQAVDAMKKAAREAFPGRDTWTGDDEYNRYEKVAASMGVKKQMWRAEVLQESLSRDDMYNFLYKLVAGDIIKVGKMRFKVENTRYGPVFSKAGTTGTKWYKAEWSPDGTLGMYPTGGSGQRIGDDVVRAVPLKEQAQVVGEVDEDDVEKAAENVHDQWMQNQKDKGHDSHKSPDGKEEYMVGYKKLSDDAKELDRDAVHAVLDALKEAKKVYGSQMPQVKGDQAYKGYLIRVNPFSGDMWIEKDKTKISSAKDVADAKKTIDMLTEAKVPDDKPDPGVYYGLEKKQSFNYKCEDCGKEISRIRWAGSGQCEKCEKKQKLNEDGMAVGGGGVAGIGVNQQGQPSTDKFAEPGVPPARKKLQPEEETFAGASVFKVDMDKIISANPSPKHPRHRYAKYIGQDEDAEDIRQYARSVAKDIVLKDKTTGVMQYLRKKK
jgi:hypothetical protein